MADGSVLPGATAQKAYVDLGWASGGWRAQARVQAQNVLWADARNAAPGFALVHLALHRDGRNTLGVWQIRMALDNVLNQLHGASVIVAEANGRFLESGAPRRLQLGVSQSL